MEGEGRGRGMSVWYVASKEICGEMSREDKKLDICCGCAQARGCRVSIMRRYSGVVSGISRLRGARGSKGGGRRTLWI